MRKPSAKHLLLKNLSLKKQLSRQLAKQKLPLMKLQKQKKLRRQQKPQQSTKPYDSKNSRSQNHW